MHNIPQFLSIYVSMCIQGGESSKRKKKKDGKVFPRTAIKSKRKTQRERERERERVREGKKLENFT
jgi:hypothetical protein